MKSFRAKLFSLAFIRICYARDRLARGTSQRCRLLASAVLFFLVAACGGGGGGSSGSGFSPSNAIILTEGDCSGNRTTGCSIDLSLAPYSRTPNRTIESSEDKDFYKLIVPSSGIINIWTEGNIDSEGQLLDTDGEIIHFSALRSYNASRAAEDFNFYLSYEAVAGDYYIVVGGSREGIYRLGFSFISDSSDGLKDGDEDGIPDGEDNCVGVRNNDQLNTDGDNEGDVCDMRMMIMMVFWMRDEAVGCALVSDCDDDGVADGEDNCVLVRNNDQLNTDRDNEGDACDADNDNDGVADADEAAARCILDPDCDDDGVADGDEAAARCILDPDCDDDGVADEEDNCVLVRNNDQLNTDGDNEGDACDVDDDGDGLIELWTADMLYNVRYSLSGLGYRESSTGSLRRVGCGGRAREVASCDGYELIANISLASYAGGEGWLPIGHDTNLDGDGCQGEPFSALFEGNGKTVKDLRISRQREDCVGLFGHISSIAQIWNLNLSAVLIVGDERVGGLVGSGDGATIRNSYAVSGSVRGRDNVGGLVGRGQAAIIMNSYAVSGSVNGTGFNVGGLVGDGRRVIVRDSYADSGVVNGDNIKVGGLVGDGHRAIIERSYAILGSVSGTNNVGGLTGGGDNVDIRNSYADSGSVSGANNVGGLTGGGNNVDIINSYADSGSVSGANNVGGLTGGGNNVDIIDSYADSGSVSGTGFNVGGLTGGGDDVDIMNSYVVSGSVSGANNVGGLAAGGGDVAISNSSAVSGLVSGANNVGGLAGGGNNVYIINSYVVSGSVNGSGNNVGGLAGDGINANIIRTLMRFPVR